MLNRLGDRGILVLALSPAAIFIIIVFIAVIGPRLNASSTPEAVTLQAPGVIVVTATIPPTTAAPPATSPQPVMPTPTVTPESIIIRQGDFARLG
jgi:hypothetical protein